MASSAIFLTIIIPSIIASTSGFSIQTQTTESEKLHPTPFPTPRFIPRTTTTDYRNQPIAGHPKVPPPNAYEAGGNDFDLLPPFEDIGVKFDPRRSVKDVEVDPKTGYPLEAEPSWKYAGGNPELPLEEAVDPNTHAGRISPLPLNAGANAQVDWKTGNRGYPGWKDGGLRDGVYVLPLLDPSSLQKTTPAPNTRRVRPLPLNAGENTQVDWKTGNRGYPGWKDGGLRDGVFVLPLLDPSSLQKTTPAPNTRAGRVRPLPLNAGANTQADWKTGNRGYPGWKDGGLRDGVYVLPLLDPSSLQKTTAAPNTRAGRVRPLPLNAGEDVENTEVDPKTGYPLKANPSWKDAGGNEEILDLPLEDLDKRSTEAVDPKTGYPLVAQDSWKYAGGDEEILQLPLEDSNAVDPKTGYPLLAQPSWKDAGGNGDILDLPLEENPDQGAVDPKTGYPLQAQPSWKDAGGNGDILELPLEDNPDQGAVDPKTGYPLTAQPSWKDAGGNGDILQLPLDDKEDDGQVPVDPKTGYPLIAQPSWKDAGGDGDILQLPLEPETAVDPKTGYPLKANPSWKDAGGNEEILDLPLEDLDKRSGEAVDPKTGYPLVAQDSWKYAGGDEDILDLPFEQPNGSQGRQFHVFEIFKLTELQPPDVLSESFYTGGASQNQKRNSFENRPVESTYTYTGPENVVVTVTRFRSTPQQSANGSSSNQQKSATSNANSGAPTTPPNVSIFRR